MDENFLIVGKSSIDGAHEWLRCEQRLKVMGDAGYRTIFMPAGADPKVTEHWLNRADIFMSGQGVGVGTMPHYFMWREETYRKTGRYVPIVWDVDDNPDFISPWNSAYENFGQEEVTIVNPDTKVERLLWENGKGGFDLVRNQLSVKSYKFLLKHVDALIVTQPYLADQLRKYNPNIEIVPNDVDFKNHYRFRNQPQRDGKVRILYMGGSSHFLDWKFIAPVLKSIVAQYPHVRICCFGDIRRWAISDLGEEFVEDMQWQGDYKSFCLKMGTMGVDMAIAPLAMEDPYEAEFNRCKSCLKWVDYGAVGIPCIAQNEIPYSPEIAFGENVPDLLWDGVLASTHEEWFLALSTMIENPTMRETIGSNAYQTVFKKWNSGTKADEYHAVFERILGYSKWTGEVDLADVSPGIAVAD